jgi:hypothetical protein
VVTLTLVQAGQAVPVVVADVGTAGQEVRELLDRDSLAARGTSPLHQVVTIAPAVAVVLER